MRTIVIHPDGIPGGWDLIDDDILLLNQSFARRQGVELPGNLLGRRGEFLRAAVGGKTIQEISELMNVCPRRVRQIFKEMLKNPGRLKKEIEIEKNALFPLQTDNLPRPKKSRRGRPVREKTPPPQKVDQHELLPNGKGGEK